MDWIYLFIIPIIFLIGVISFLFFKSTYNPTQASITCQPGTQNVVNVGCTSCLSPSCTTCQSDSDCKNGGSCKKINNAATGVCECPAPYFGNNCEKTCSDEVPCPNNQICKNGTCIECNASNCQGPGCNLNTCPKCSDGWVTDPSDPAGQICGTCDKGRWPVGDCSKSGSCVNNPCPCKSDSECPPNTKCDGAICDNPCNCSEVGITGKCGDWDLSGSKWCYVKDGPACIAAGGIVTNGKHGYWKDCSGCIFDSC
jgi:hypothetical protein